MLYVQNVDIKINISMSTRIFVLLYVCISTATYKIIETEYDEYALIYRCIREWPNGGCARQDRNVKMMSRKRTLESKVIKRLLEIMVAALGMDARMMHYTKRTGMSSSLLMVYACKTSIYRRHITLTESPTIQNLCKKLMLLEYFFSCYHFDDDGGGDDDDDVALMMMIYH